MPTMTSYKRAKLLQRPGFDWKQVEGSLSGSEQIGLWGGGRHRADGANRRVEIRVAVKQNEFAMNEDTANLRSSSTRSPEVRGMMDQFVCERRTTNGYPQAFRNHKHELLVK